MKSVDSRQSLSDSWGGLDNFTMLATEKSAAW